MQMAGAVFASSGQSVDSLTTALALMGNAGIAGSDAGTSLKTMLMRLAAPTDDAADVLAVSYTHLDVYKRQMLACRKQNKKTSARLRTHHHARLAGRIAPALRMASRSDENDEMGMA